MVMVHGMLVRGKAHEIMMRLRCRQDISGHSMMTCSNEDWQLLSDSR